MTRLFLWKFNAANKSFQTKEAASNENQQNVEASPSAGNYNITLNFNFSILILFYFYFVSYIKTNCHLDNLLLNFMVRLNNQIVETVGQKPDEITNIKPPMLIIFPIEKNHC